MRSERYVQIGFATFATLSTLLLSMGQRDSHLPYLVGIAALASLVFTDTLGWIRINRPMANLAAIVATLVSTFGVARLELSSLASLRPDSESLLMAAAFLLVYLSIVLLFQRKDDRIYWELAMTSLLQVVVAGALNDSFAFGVLLMIYAVVGMTTLSVFFVHRQRRRFGGIVTGSVDGGADSKGREPARFRGSVTGELSRLVTGWTIAKSVLNIFFGSVIFTTILFFSLPRLGRSTIQNSNLATQRVVGFSSEVELGELGSVAQNTEVVMSVEFHDAYSQAPVVVEGEPYFRGSILVKYSNGRWQRPDALAVGQVSDLREAPSGLGTLHQTITLEPLSEPVICCVYPVYWPRGVDAEDSGVGRDTRNDQIIRDEPNRRRRFQVDLATTGIWRNKQYEFAAGDQPDQRSFEVAEGLSTLTELANQIVADSGLPPEDVVGKARALERYFLEPDRFQYSLEPPSRDRTIDPVEDFVRNHRQGHCEYFASALALMLRTQGIPSRVVVGYKGGEWNPLGQFYQVRQLHAHAWVEAYLWPDQVPPYPAGHPDQNVPYRRNRRGAWMRLDPTPGSTEIGEVADTLSVLGIRQVFDYTKRLWHSHVVGLTSRRQQEDIYRPVAKRLQTAIKRLSSANTWREIGRGIADFFRGNFNWEGGVAAMAFCLAISGIFYGGRAVFRRVRRWAAGRKRRLARRRAATRVEFFRQFELLLKRGGWTRSEGQTALELAGQVQSDMRAWRLGHAEVPRKIVEDYYRVRYGGDRLDKGESDRIEQSLRALKAELSAVRRRNGHN